MQTYKIIYDKELCFQDFDNYSRVLAQRTKRFLVAVLLIFIIALILFFIFDSEKKFIVESIVVGSSISLVLFSAKYLIEILSPRRKIRQLAGNPQGEYEIISVDEKTLDATVFGFNLKANWNEFKYAFLINGTLFISRKRQELPIRFNPKETSPVLYDFVLNKMEHIIKENEHSEIV